MDCPKIFTPASVKFRFVEQLLESYRRLSKTRFCILPCTKRILFLSNFRSAIKAPIYNDDNNTKRYH